MICVIVICALVTSGGPRECDVKTPSRAIYLEAPSVIEKQADCVGALRSARALRQPGEWPFRVESVPSRKPKTGEEE